MQATARGARAKGLAQAAAIVALAKAMALRSNPVSVLALLTQGAISPLPKAGARCAMERL